MPKINMDTFTPNLALTRNNALKSGSTVIHHIAAEKIVLFVGHAYADVPPADNRFKFLVTEKAADARQVIAQLLNVYRKIPAVIIYKFSSQYESDLAEWEAYFSTHRILRSIPFFLYSAEPSPALKTLVKQHTFIDEIVTRECMQKLDSKVDFVSKFKRMYTLDTRKADVHHTRPLYSSNRWNRMLKRGFDIAVAGTALVAAAPVMLVIAALIKLESKGPVIYASPRAGKNYRIFKFYKFRTMVNNADQQLQALQHLNQYKQDTNSAVFYKVSNDPRVTKLGSFLRNSSLDEIPQLFNVIMGDMSLVGNRPLPLYEAASLTTDEHVERFLAPAGITGLWQISKRGKKDMSTEERILLDINYAHRHSFAYDMWLFLNTPFALIQKDNV
jgi:lipopolysaccharide/colanic/teichoic acid biosynthesis glycosyltransferase